MPQTLSILAAAGTGEGATVEMPDPEVREKYVVKTLYIYGAFNSATVAVEISPDGGTTWFPITDLTAVAAKTVTQLHLTATHIRGVVTGGSSPAINMVLL